MCDAKDSAVRSERNLSRRGVLVAAAGVLGAAGAAAIRPARAQGAPKPKPKPIPQPDKPGPKAFMARAEDMRALAVRSGDQGYGAVIVKNSVIVGQAPSRVVVNKDPTAHAEMEAIRDACRRLGTSNLAGCALYGTSRACPMCETGAYWAGLDRLYYGTSAARITDAGKPGYPNC